MESKIEIIDEMTRVIYIIAACIAIGCAPRNPLSPSNATKGSLKDTDTHLRQADKEIDKPDLPAAKKEIGAGIDSNNAAAKGHDATVKWYEQRVTDRDNAIIDLKKQSEKDRKTLDKGIVKAALWIDGMIKILIGLASAFAVLWVINKFVKQIPFFGGFMSFIAKIF